MTGDFNIRDSSWNTSFPHHSVHWGMLMDITDFMNLYISKSTNQVSTRYLNNSNNSNLVIDLMFLQPASSEFDNYMIWPEWRLLSDHAPLTVNIAIIKEQIQTKKHTIVKNSIEESKFLVELSNLIERLNTEHISSKEVLEEIVQ